MKRRKRRSRAYYEARDAADKIVLNEGIAFVAGIGLFILGFSLAVGAAMSTNDPFGLRRFHSMRALLVLGIFSAGNLVYVYAIGEPSGRSATYIGLAWVAWGLILYGYT